MFTQDELKSIFKYNPDTGVFTWRTNRRGGARADTVAGTVVRPKEGKHFIKLRANGKGCAAHRLAWLYMYGHLPDTVKHKNGDGLDNRLNNLCRSPQGKPKYNKNLMFRPDDEMWVAYSSLSGVAVYIGDYSDRDEALRAVEQYETELSQKMFF